MICPSCGYDNNEDGQYCSQCGLPLVIDGESAEDAKQPSPKLSKVVPYVIPGQETGFIPRYNADRDPEPSDFQIEEGADDILAQGKADALPDAQPASDEAEGEAASGDEAAGRKAPTGSEEPAGPEEDAPCAEDAEGQKPASDEAPAAPECEGSAQTCVDSQEPASTDAADVDSAPEDPASDEAVSSDAVSDDAEAADPAPEGAADAEGASDSEEAVQDAEPSEGAADEEAGPNRVTAPAGMVSWDKEFPTVQITASMPEAIEEDEGPAGDDTAAGDDSASAEGEEADAEEAGKKASDEAGAANADSAQEGEAGQEDASEAPESEDDDEEDDGCTPVGKHSKPIDRSAKTVKMDRLPKPGPGSTAVIPSISVSGPTRYSDTDREKADAQRKKAARTMALIVIAAIIAVCALVFGIRSCSTGTTVPDVVNTSSREARARLDAAGFEVQVESKVTDEAEDGTVLECDPSCGSKQRKGSMVTLTVAASQTIPDVVGMELDSARNMLEEQGAKNVKVEAKESNQPENTVIAVSPETGKAFSPDDEITLTVATTAYLPDVVSLDLNEAKTILIEAGYEPEVEWVESDQSANVVIASDPEANSLANLGSTVTLTVSSPGPSNFMHIMDYFSVSSSDLSEYLKWKGFGVTGSYTYTDEWSGTEYVSQLWGASDKCTVSFTPAPYIEDKGLDPVDYMAQDKPFQAVRIFIPKDSSLSLGTDLSMSNVKKYMDACGLQNLSDSCTKEDMEYNGKSGKEMGMDEFVCGQGEMNGMVWTILITEKGTFIGAGGFECYPDMDPIADSVAVNEMYSGKTAL